MAETNAIEMMISEAENKYARQVDSIQALKDSAGTIFSASSLIVSLISLFQILDKPPAPGRESVFITVLVVIAGLYLWLVITCLNVLRPSEYHGPVEISYQTYEGHFQGKSLENLLDMKLRLYIRAIETNDLVISRLQTSTQRAYRLLPWLIAAIIALAVLPMIA